MKAIRLDLLLQRYQLDPESPVEPREIKELTVRVMETLNYVYQLSKI